MPLISGYSHRYEAIDIFDIIRTAYGAGRRTSSVRSGKFRFIIFFSIARLLGMRLFCILKLECSVFAYHRRIDLDTMP